MGFAIEISTATLPLAIEALVKRLVARPGFTTEANAAFIVGFDAECHEPENTIFRGVETIMAIAADHHAIVIDCMVDGFRQTGEGYRVWGTIECQESSDAAPLSTRVDALTIAESQDGWEISATITEWKDES